jgi:hypothetical protein
MFNNVSEAGSTPSSGKCMKPTLLDPRDGAHCNLAIQILSSDDRNTPSYEDIIFNHSETIQMSKIPSV